MPVLTKRKKVLLTVNPDLIAGKRLMTVRSLVTSLDKHADLYVVPISEIDFKSGKMHSYRRLPGGKFQKHGLTSPNADLWIIYTDGYYQDVKKLGYKRRLDYINQQLAFYQNAYDSGIVGHMVNQPGAERKTMKDWFVQLDCARLGLIPTFSVASRNELHDLLKEHTIVVAKPIWGGGGYGVHKLDSESSVHSFMVDINTRSEKLDDYIFQKHSLGPEKRLWFTGKRFAGGRICFGRKTPWSPDKHTYYAERYDLGTEFEHDLAVATKLWNLSGLGVGSVDFIGDQVNEINGCGTTYTYYQDWKKIVDARQKLIDYVLQVLTL